MKLLSKIQKELKAPKGQMNTFGKYKYRSCEDILEAVKPLLGEAVLTISDEIILIGERHYVKATATLTQDTASISVSAFAREALVKKGMDESQITGAASSYARKYALNGLFCIDDTKDADTQDNRKPASKATKQPNPDKEPTEKQSAILKQAHTAYLIDKKDEVLEGFDIDRKLWWVQAKTRPLPNEMSDIKTLNDAIELAKVVKEIKSDT